MNQHIAKVTLVVNDYNEAINFYVNKLQFNLLEDTWLSETKRWVVVAPNGDATCGILLAKAENEAQRSRVGNQAGGRVFLFLYTDDFGRDYRNLLDNQVSIVRQPITETHGTVAVFADLYGNLWDLIQRTK